MSAEEMHDDMPDDDRFDDDRCDDAPDSVRGDRAAVIYPSVEIGKTVDASIEALRADPELYVRGGALTRVIESDGSECDAITREQGAPTMRRVTPTFLIERLSVGERIRFMKRKTVGRGDNKKTIEVQIPPPSGLAQHIIERGAWPGYRALHGIVTSPTMRRDGSVLQTAGYDAASGLLYLPRGTSYPLVPESPTHEQAVAARDRLLDVVDDFPMGEVARAAWLASLFTLCARELVDGSVPMIAHDASTPGSGKGLSVRAKHLIAYGTEIAHMSLPPNEEEFRKQITTTLLSGDPAVLLDNVGVPIGGDSIEALITAPTWKVRLLGKNEDSGAIKPRLVTYAAGNGLEFIGDMGRRTLRIRIDTRQELPEERTDFKHPDRAGEDNFLGWVRANRASLVVDALTCLRAWHVAGRPGVVKNWGSFSSWASTIATAVTWLGMPDPTLARATQDAAADPVRQALGVVYDAIRRLQATRGVTAGELVRAAFPAPSQGPNEFADVAEAIGTLTPMAGNDAATRARLLGRKLKAGRIINGQKLATAIAGGGVTRYSVSDHASGDSGRN